MRGGFLGHIAPGLRCETWGIRICGERGSPAAVGGFAWVISLHAGNSFQILVDSAEIVLRQVFVGRPWHHLKERAIKWRRNA